ADQRHLAEIGQEPATRLAVRMAHIVARHHGLAGKFATTRHGFFLTAQLDGPAHEAGQAGTYKRRGRVSQGVAAKRGASGPLFPIFPPPTPLGGWKPQATPYFSKTSFSSRLAARVGVIVPALTAASS